MEHVQALKHKDILLKIYFYFERLSTLSSTPQDLVIHILNPDLLTSYNSTRKREILNITHARTHKT